MFYSLAFCRADTLVENVGLLIMVVLNVRSYSKPIELTLSRGGRKYDSWPCPFRD